MFNNVSFVFPYVNPTDPNWQKDYEYSKGEKYKSSERFRDFSMLKYIFRSIEMYAPWINQVVILVSSRSQLPEYINQNSSLVIVEHKDFIPSQYLPTFNSNTIEMFLPNLDCLYEHFIYSNDDLIFVNKTNYEDFFRLGTPLLSLVGGNQDRPGTFRDCCKRTWDLTKDINKYDTGEFSYMRQFHGAASPRLLSDCKQCFTHYEKQILDSLTRFRSFRQNLNQYLYGYYSLAKNRASVITTQRIGSYVSAEDGIGRIVDAINNCPAKMLCINDTANMTEPVFKVIQDTLEARFPNKSRFEF